MKKIFNKMFFGMKEQSLKSRLWRVILVRRFLSVMFFTLSVFNGCISFKSPEFKDIDDQADVRKVYAVEKNGIVFRLIYEIDAEKFVIQQIIETEFSFPNLKRSFSGKKRLLWREEHLSEFLSEEISEILRLEGYNKMNVYLKRHQMLFLQDTANDSCFYFSPVCSSKMKTQLALTADIELNGMTRNECIKSDQFVFMEKENDFLITTNWIYPVAIAGLISPPSTIRNIFDASLVVSFIYLYRQNINMADSFALQNLTEYKTHLMEVIRNAKEKNLFRKCE